ncbi:MAG TPA: hypothetical protein VLA96_12065 [Terriglobales bacterium]|nr:hypothetical protein [Terriglobales bacterium]
MRTLTHSLLLISVVAGAASHAQEPGKVTDPVVTTADARQSYALYLPSAYNREKKWPVILVFDPSGIGAEPMGSFQAAAERHGYLVAASNNSRNGPARISMEAFVAMYDDVRKRFAVDDARIYAAGFSGGARVAGMAALYCGGCIRGIIACGAGLPYNITEDGRRKLPAYFFTIGRYDFNYFEVFDAARSLAAPRVVAVFEGAHQWLTPELAERALAWLDAGAGTSEVAAETPQESAQRKQLAELTRSLLERLRAAVRPGEERAQNLRDLRSEMTALRKKREQATGEDLVVLRRALGQALVGVHQTASELGGEDPELGAGLMEAAVEANPKYAGFPYEMAGYWAAAGNKKKALNALKRAVELGFKDKQALASSKSFDKLRESEEFQAIANSMAKK